MNDLINRLRNQGQITLYLEAADRIEQLQCDLETERQRLVACSVAALGYFDGCCDEYKSASLNDVLSLRDQLTEAKKQRDELLAALERFMDSHEECTDFDGFTAQIVSMADYHQAQEAIASVKEKK